MLNTIHETADFHYLGDIADAHAFTNEACHELFQTFIISPAEVHDLTRTSWLFSAE
jgi:hypothetical protein